MKKVLELGACPRAMYEQIMVSRAMLCGRVWIAPHHCIIRGSRESSPGWLLCLVALDLESSQTSTVISLRDVKTTEESQAFLLGKDLH
jgi:hypothetical protein